MNKNVKLLIGIIAGILILTNSVYAAKLDSLNYKLSTKPLSDLSYIKSSSWKPEVDINDLKLPVGASATTIDDNQKSRLDTIVQYLINYGDIIPDERNNIGKNLQVVVVENLNNARCVERPNGDVIICIDKSYLNPSTDVQLSNSVLQGVIAHELSHAALNHSKAIADTSRQQEIDADERGAILAFKAFQNAAAVEDKAKYELYFSTNSKLSFDSYYNNMTKTKVDMKTGKTYEQLNSNNKDYLHSLLGKDNDTILFTTDEMDHPYTVNRILMLDKVRLLLENYNNSNFDKKAVLNRLKEIGRGSDYQYTHQYIDFYINTKGAIAALNEDNTKTSKEGYSLCSVTDMQQYLSLVTNSGTSHIGTAQYFMGNKNADKFVMDSGKKIDLHNQTVVERSHYINNGQIVETPVDIQLAWTAYRDIDLHLAGPTGSGNLRFHIYFAQQGSLAGAPNAYLYHDDTIGGPGAKEQVRINQLNSGIYRVYLHDYTGRALVGDNFGLRNSGSVVTFHIAGSSDPRGAGYNLGREIGRVIVPAGLNRNTWLALEYDSRTKILRLADPRNIQSANIANPSQVAFKQ